MHNNINYELTTKPENKRKIIIGLPGMFLSYEDPNFELVEERATLTQLGN